MSMPASVSTVQVGRKRFIRCTKVQKIKFVVSSLKFALVNYPFFFKQPPLQYLCSNGWFHHASKVSEQSKQRKTWTLLINGVGPRRLTLPPPHLLKSTWLLWRVDPTSKDLCFVKSLSCQRLCLLLDSVSQETLGGQWDYRRWGLDGGSDPSESCLRKIDLSPALSCYSQPLGCPDVGSFPPWYPCILPWVQKQ